MVSRAQHLALYLTFNKCSVNTCQSSGYFAHCFLFLNPLIPPQPTRFLTWEEMNALEHNLWPFLLITYGLCYLAIFSFQKLFLAKRYQRREMQWIYLFPSLQFINRFKLVTHTQQKQKGIFNTKAPFLASFSSQSLRRVMNIPKDFWIPSS